MVQVHSSKILLVQVRELSLLVSSRKKSVQQVNIKTNIPSTHGMYIINIM